MSFRYTMVSVVAVATACVIATPALAQTARFAVSAQAAATGVPTFARQANVQLLISDADAKGRRTNSLRGDLDVATALTRLLAGTGLVARPTGTSSFAIVAETRTADGSAPAQSESSDIVVTAQRRAESIATTAVAVTAITGERIAREAVTTIDALENLTPSLTLNQGGQAATGGFRIRGIGTETFSAGVEPAVATFVDGVLVGRTTNVTSLQLVDIERVEVLRGPQGTLFGKNASSGVVSIVTKGPAREFGAGVIATIAERDEYNVQGFVTGPLSESLSFRLTAFGAGHDGHIRNTVPDASSLWAPLLVTQPNLLRDINLYKDDDFYNLRAFGLRGKLKYDGPGVTSLLTVDFANSVSDCCARTFIEFYAPGTGLNRRIFGADIGRESTETAADAPLKGKDESFSVIFDNTFAIGGGFELVSLSGYRNQLNETIEDQDFGAGPELGLPAFFDKAEFDFRRSRTKQFSQELRLVSPLRQALGGQLAYDFVLGGYYFSQDDAFGPGNRRIQIINNTTPTPIAGCSTPVCRRDFVYQVRLNSNNAALFGQANLHIGDKLTLFYGGRYTRDIIRYDWSSRDDPFAPFRQGTFKRRERVSASNYSQRVGAELEVRPTTFVYASYAEGYKGPGFRTFERIGFEEALNPERAKAYEIGTRLRFPTLKTFVGLTLYRQDYNDLVVSGFDQTLRITRNFNAAKARSQGVELDFVSSPVEGLNLSGGLAYSDNKYVSFPGTGCYPFQTATLGCVLDPVANRTLQNLAGAPLQRAPAFKANISVRYELPPISDGGLAPFVGGNYRWVSEQQYGGNNDPKTLQPAYGVLDLSAGVRSTTGNLELRIFAKNVLDKFYATNIFSTDNWLNQRVPRDHRRYFGLTVSARY